MVQNRHLSNQFPRVWNVFEQFLDGMWYIFEGPKMYMFVISKHPVALITMILVEHVQVANLGMMSESGYNHTRHSGSPVFPKSTFQASKGSA
jgi:hypothetical protein